MEDVDLTYDIRQIIPDLIDNPIDSYPPSRSQARKWTQTVRARLSTWVEAGPLQILTDRIQTSGVDAKAILNDDNIVLEYEAVRSGTGYVRPAVLLEFSARTTGEPTNRHKITCDIAEAIIDLQTPIANPRVMRVERTFWEKATAIHAYA